MLYDLAIRPLLFAISQGDPERAHKLVIALLHYLGRSQQFANMISWRMTVQDPVDLLGIHFPNRVGLAAGFDKDALAMWMLWAMGFGFLEVGTVTAQQQYGNPKPRIWRFPKDQALINAMGFNNRGADAMAQAFVASGIPPLPVGISIGKSRVVDPEDLQAVIDDHLHSLRLLRSFGDYFVLNVSSPNTPGLRELQDKKQLSALVGALQKELAIMENREPPKTLVHQDCPRPDQRSHGRRTSGMCG